MLDLATICNPVIRQKQLLHTSKIPISQYAQLKKTTICNQEKAKSDFLLNRATRSTFLGNNLQPSKMGNEEHPIGQHLQPSKNQVGQQGGLSWSSLLCRMLARPPGSLPLPLSHPFITRCHDHQHQQSLYHRQHRQDDSFPCAVYMASHQDSHQIKQRTSFSCSVCC